MRVLSKDSFSDFFSMVLTTTAIDFSLFSLGLGLCGLRFFNAFHKIGGARAGSKIGILLSVFFLSDAVAIGILAIGAFSFTRNPEALYMLLVTSHIFLTITAMSAAYTIFYIFFPSIPPWSAAVAALTLGMTIIIATIIAHPHPFLDAGGGIDWNMPQWLSTLFSSLLLLIIGAPLVIFGHSFLMAKSRDVRMISLLLALAAFAGITNSLWRFLFSGGGVPLFWRTPIFDNIFAVMGLLFIGVFILPPVMLKRFSHIAHNHSE